MRSLLLVLVLSCLSLASRADDWSFKPADTLYADTGRRIALGDFEGLLQDADHFQQSQERLPDGRWKLSTFYGGLHSGFARVAQDDADWARLEAAAKALTQQHEASSNAWVMLAAVYESHAWKVRGIGFANTVSHEQFARFGALIEQARAVLDAHKGSPESNPQWYAMRIDVGGASSQSDAELDAVFEEALRTSPNYHEIWFDRMNYLSPKWGGSVEKVVAFIGRSARYPSATDGTGLMARLLWVADDCGCADILEQPGLDWVAIDKSYDDVLDRFPADFNAQHFVLQACARGDKAETTHLLRRVSFSAPRIGRWQPGYERCRAWAEDKALPVVPRDAATNHPAWLD